MFSPNAKLINCNTCGDKTEQLIKNGKRIHHCLKCRELNTNNKKQCKQHNTTQNITKRMIL